MNGWEGVRRGLGAAKDGADAGMEASVGKCIAAAHGCGSVE